MSEYMTELCRQGADLIFKQCDSSRFQEGYNLLDRAARGGDAEAWYFMGLCFSWGYGDVGFSREKAYDCYLRAARAGSSLGILGALRAGLYDDMLRRAQTMTPEQALERLQKQAEKDPWAAWQAALSMEWEDLDQLPKKKEENRSEEAAAKEETSKEGTEEAAPAEDAPAFAPKPVFAYYLLAAEGGIVPAMEKVGRCYLEGHLTEANAEEYSRWADCCAQAGNAWGLAELGIYFNSVMEWQPAFQYLSAAEAQGERRAPLLLGRLYIAGRGCDRNVSEAVRCFEKAAEYGDEAAYLELGNLFYQDKLVERDDEKAFYWYEMAYKAGLSSAALPLAHLYMRDTAARDYGRAMALFEEASDSSDPRVAGEACLTMGNIHRDGITGVTDPEEAIRWYEKGAEAGQAECMEVLGILYYQGEDGLEKDYDKAFFWLSKCRENGTLQSASKLATLYLHGEGCEADEEKAMTLFAEASKTEYDGYACYMLGQILEEKGGQEALESAAEYYQKASEMGYEGAAKQLSRFKRNLFGRWKVEKRSE